MWTYLAIFLSVAVLIGVFVRKYFLLDSNALKKTDIQVDEHEDAPEKKRIRRDDKEKMEKLFKRGESLLNSGKDEEAIKCFVQILAIDALHTESQHKLALLYLQKQMYGAAAALFKQLSEAAPDPVHFSHLGLALFHQKDFEGAKSAYQKALDLDPSRPQRFVSLSQVYKAMGNFQNAVVALNKAIEMDKENMEVLFLLADVQEEMGNTEEACEILNRVLEMAPENEDAKSLLKDVIENKET